MFDSHPFRREERVEVAVYHAEGLGLAVSTGRKPDLGDVMLKAMEARAGKNGEVRRGEIVGQVGMTP